MNILVKIEFTQLWSLELVEGSLTLKKIIKKMALSQKQISEKKVNIIEMLLFSVFVIEMSQYITMGFC